MPSGNARRIKIKPLLKKQTQTRNLDDQVWFEYLTKSTTLVSSKSTSCS